MSVSATYLTKVATPAVGFWALFLSSVPATVLLLLTLLSLCMSVPAQRGSPSSAQVLSSFAAQGVCSPGDQIGERVCLCACVFVISHHEVWLCEDPPELLGLHILRVA